MNKEKLISSIEKELKKIEDNNTDLRNKMISDTIGELENNEAGTVDSCYAIRNLLMYENELRKVKNAYVQWPKATEVISTHAELALDKMWYDWDYEIVDSYSWRMIVNDRIVLCIKLKRCGCREIIGISKDPLTTVSASCEFEWGIIDLKRSRYLDKFKVDNKSTCGDYNSMVRMREALSTQCDSLWRRKKKHE